MIRAGVVVYLDSAMGVTVSLGLATKVATRRSVAERGHDGQARVEAKEGADVFAGEFPAGCRGGMWGRGLQMRWRGRGIIVWACSVLPEHCIRK